MRRNLRLNMPPTEALIAARCMELLNTFDTSLLADLRQLSDADAETFPDRPRCSHLLRMYSEVTTLHISMMLHETWVGPRHLVTIIAGCANELPCASCNRRAEDLPEHSQLSSGRVTAQRRSCQARSW